jgi:hypothetical protein
MHGHGQNEFTVPIVPKLLEIIDRPIFFMFHLCFQVSLPLIHFKCLASLL